MATNINDKIRCNSCFKEIANNLINTINYCPFCGGQIIQSNLLYDISNDCRNIFINKQGLKIITTICDGFCEDYPYDLNSPLIENGLIFHTDNYSKERGFIDILDDKEFFPNNGLCIFCDDLAMYGDLSENARFFLDRNFKTVLEVFGYDKVNSFSCGLALVKKNNLYGFINKKGEEVIKCQFVDATSFEFGFSIIKKYNSYNYKFGCIDTDGKIIAECKYNDIIIFSCGFISATTRTDLEKCIQLIDKRGKIIFEKTSSDLEYIIYLGGNIIHLWCPKQALHEIYKFTCFFYNGLNYRFKEIKYQNKFNLVCAQGFGEFKNGMAVVNYFKDNCGRFNRAYLTLESEFITFNDDTPHLSFFSKDGYAIIKDRSSWFLLYKDGSRKSFKNKYSLLGHGNNNFLKCSNREFTDGLISFVGSQTSGYIDIDENIIIDDKGKYQFRGEFHIGIAPIIRKDDEKELYGFINKKNQIVLPFIYDRVYFCEKSNAFLGDIHHEFSRSFNGGFHHVIFECP